jgi:hypothetical protein
MARVPADSWKRSRWERANRATAAVVGAKAGMSCSRVPSERWPVSAFGERVIVGISTAATEKPGLATLT